MGVRRAVNLTLDAARDRPPPIHTLGPLIHNPQVVDMLSERGVSPAGEELPEEGTVVIRSHGVKPSIKRELKKSGLDVFDATCPRVARVHGIVSKHHKKGYLIVVLGDPGHAEVDGIVGYADGEAAVITGPQGVEDLPETDKLCFVAQTTQERERFFETADALRKRYPKLDEECLIIADTICDSTRNRQEEIRRLAGQVEAVVVVGGKGSANTNRLAEVAREEGVPAYLAETEEDLDKEELKKYKVVGLTAGASTPNWMIRRIYDELQDISGREGALDRTKTFVKGAIKWMIMSNIYVALGAGALTVAAARVQGFWPLWREAAISALFVFAIHTITLISDPRSLALNVPQRAMSFSRYRGRWMVISITATVLALAMAFTMGIYTGLVLLLLGIASFLYPRRLIIMEKLNLRIRSLAEVPAGKDLFMAAGWATLVVLIPLIHFQWRSTSPFASVAALVMVMGLVFVRALLRDFRDIQADRLIGRETLPVALGVNRTRKLLYGTLVVLGVMMAVLTMAGYIESPLGYLMVAPLAYAALCVPLFTRQTIVQGFGAELVIDAVFLLGGLMAWIAYILESGKVLPWL